MTDLPTLATQRFWYCPNCRLEDVTHEARPHTRFHSCPAIMGLTAPMLPKGTRAKVEVVEREDYVGKEKVMIAPNGRPIMAVSTTRDDGEDRIVFAPAATMRSS